MREAARRKPILFVSHEATRTGAPMMLLHIIRWLRKHTNQECAVLLGRGGPLEPDFAELGPIYTPEELNSAPALLQQFGLIYSNTACNGLLIETLPYGDLPIVTHVHELDFGIDCLGAANMASVIRHTTHFFVCAQVLADRLHQRFRIPRTRISVHYECVPYDTIVANAGGDADADAPRRYDIPHGAFVLAGCGTIDVRKAPDLFVQLAHYVRQHANLSRPLRFLWIGKVNDYILYNMLRHDLRRLGLQDIVTFVGEMASPHALLARADVFCLTSREDPFPLVMLESAALGKPVLCFEGAGGGAEFCAGGGGVAIPFLDVKAMADECAALLADDERRAAMGRRAADSIRTRFDAAVVVPPLWKELRRFQSKALPPSALQRRKKTLPAIYAGWSLDEAPDQASVRLHLELRAPLEKATSLRAAGRYDAAARVIVRAVGATLATGTPEAVDAAHILVDEAFTPLFVDRTVLPPQDDFDDDGYLTLNPDIQHGVDTGFFTSGWDHFLKHGLREKRAWRSRRDTALQEAMTLLKAGDAAGAEAALDAAFRAAHPAAAAETLLRCSA